MTKIIAVVPARWKVSDSLEATENVESMTVEVGNRRGRMGLAFVALIGQTTVHPSGHADVNSGWV